MEYFEGPADDFELPWEADKPRDMKPNDWAYKKAFEAHGIAINMIDYHKDEKAFLNDVLSFEQKREEEKKRFDPKAGVEFKTNKLQP